MKKKILINMKMKKKLKNILKLKLMAKQFPSIILLNLQKLEPLKLNMNLPVT